MHFKKYLPLIVIFPLMVSCSSSQLFQSKYVEEAKVTDRTRAGNLLASIPAASEKIPVSLYDFQDLTGQFKNNEKYTEYSSAVTKGGHAILTKALLDAGSKKWFTVVERGSFKNLLQERNIIDVTRNQYRGPDGSKLPSLPPLIYGPLLIEGGIISYDSNIITGGAGATYLGINGNVRYNRDMVTIYLRAVKVETGEVLLSVTSSKTVFSTSTDTNLIKYITFDRLLNAEAGFSVNEPVQLAVRQAIETGVYSMIMEGALEKVWDFKDQGAGQAALHEYLVRRDGKDAAMAQMRDAQEQQVAQVETATVAAAPIPAATASDMAPAAGGPVPNAAPAPANAMPPELAETIMPPVKSEPVQSADNNAAPVNGSDAAALAPAAGSAPAPQPQPVAQPSSSQNLNDSAYAQRRKLVLPSEDPNYGRVTRH